MGYRWKPSKSQRRVFAENMKNEDFASEYYARQEDKAEKRRQGSQFDYQSAGGRYIPTAHQHNMAFKFLAEKELDDKQKEACNMVISAYSCQEKVHHDYIHIVNEMIRSTI